MTLKVKVPPKLIAKPRFISMAWIILGHLYMIPNMGVYTGVPRVDNRKTIMDVS